MAAITTPPLHTSQLLRRTTINRAFAVIYASAIFALFYHHLLTLRRSTTFLSSAATAAFLIADAVLAFMWTTTTSFRPFPTSRTVFPENLETVLEKKDFPALDIFICTADPYKEPPMNVVNTALSLMAYDYPPEKISVYVSDDGGSELTLFAFFEAAKFAKTWLPFCRSNNIVDRSPEALFLRSNGITFSDGPQIKTYPRTLKINIHPPKFGNISQKVRIERLCGGVWNLTAFMSLCFHYNLIWRRIARRFPGMSWLLGAFVVGTDVAISWVVLRIVNRKGA